MASFVLIPGAMHNSWTWDRVVPLLERAGHRVVAPDLPGMGTNMSIAPADVTLDDWAKFVAGLVREAEAPVILVAHSRGGLVIGEAAERVPELVQGLIYVTALIVPPGKSGREMSSARREPGAPPGPAVGEIDPEVATAMFYNRCTPEDAAWAVAQLCPEPMRPLDTPVGVSWERWGRVPRAYVECTDDRVLAPERQRLMQEAAPCDPVIRLATDHSPFLSAPEALVAAMIEIAERFAARS